jgi:type II secretory pathway pseudopilin PulG
MEREGFGGFELLVIVIAGIALASGRRGVGGSVAGAGRRRAAGGSRSLRRPMLRRASRPT